MTPDEAKQVLENAMQTVSGWEVVMNMTNSDETVRQGVLAGLLTMFYKAAGSEGDAFLKEGESYEGAIGRFLSDSPGSNNWLRVKIDEVVETAFEHRRRWRS